MTATAEEEDSMTIFAITQAASEFEAAAVVEPPTRYLSDVYRTGIMFTPEDGEPVRLTESSIGLTEGRILWSFARQLAPKMIIETGFGRGGSAAFFLAALYPWGGRLISIDPAFRCWTSGVGIAYIDRLGLLECHTLIEKPSELVLANMILEGGAPSLRLSFIDGSHHFDGTLIDFMYLDRMTEVGGIIAIDDAHAPAVRTVLSFVAHNLPYQIHFPTARLVLCRKTATHHREWCHFKPFRSSQRSDWSVHEERPDVESIPGATFDVSVSP
jgi:predicted O-methyltransferase YrrM